MTSPSRTEPPEALGPGTPDPSGLVVYGDAAAPGAPVHIEPRMSPAERERNRAEAERNARCPRCMAIPDELVASLTAALKPGASPR
jgi:hypothetical protein